MNNKKDISRRRFVASAVSAAHRVEADTPQGCRVTDPLPLLAVVPRHSPV